MALVGLQAVAFADPAAPFAKPIDADTILKTPPAHQAKVSRLNGVMTISVDGTPITGLGWADIAPHYIRDAELKQMVAEIGGSLVRVVTPIGDSITKIYPTTSWDGKDGFDFSYVDTQIGRVLKCNPDARIIVMLALDGSKGWAADHPEAMDAELGVPDYLSPEWRKTSRDVIRQFVAHVQSSSYGASVIGYQLYNGTSMDCNFESSAVTAHALAEFHAFLKGKYSTDEALATAWNSPGLTLDTARQISLKAAWATANSPIALLIEPQRERSALDTLEFRGLEYGRVVMNFAHDVKEATQGKSLAGGRLGDFIGNNGWIWADALGDCQIGCVAQLSQCPDFDFYDVQEPYVGRSLGLGSGVPVLPVQGLAQDNKLVFIQNDVRTHLSLPTAGYGRTKDLESTIQLQRRIFVNAFIYGATPYLWQQDYHYNAPEMMQDYRAQSAIFDKGLKVDRSSGAEVAFVFDRDYRRYLGFDPLKSQPSRGFAMLDYIKYPWLRMGAPFDMVFLDQLDKLPPYKVYVFVHTLALDAAQRAMIQKVTGHDNQVSIYMWADGIIDRKGEFSGDSVFDLTGIKVKMARTEYNWKLGPSDWFKTQLPKAVSNDSVGTSVSDPCDPNSANNQYSPSFQVDDRSAQPIGMRDDGAVGAAVKKIQNHWSIYTSSAVVTTPILRYALSLAGGFNFTDSDAQVMIDRSFVGIHTYRDEAIELRFPQPTTLYDAFDDKEYGPGKQVKMPLAKDKTYLLFRGSKEAWEALGHPAVEDRQEQKAVSQN